LESSGATEGRNFWALNSTQPSAALVMIKVLPALIDIYRILKRKDEQLVMNLLVTGFL
jgi:hypothetical protein